MGMNLSSMGIGGIGVSPSQMLSLATDRLYDQLVDKDTKDFDGFLAAILETFSTINMALPGKHYDPPSHKDVTGLFEQWQKASSPESRKQIFTEFLRKNVDINKVDESMIITAIVAPPAAMVAKRTGQSLPQLKLMKAVPDVVFVPSATVVALIAVKILRLMYLKKKTPSDIPPPPPPPQGEPPEGRKPVAPIKDKTQPQLPPRGKHSESGLCPICNIVH